MIGNDSILKEDLELISNSDIPIEEMKNKTILITGATGLIGVQLVKTLICCNIMRNINVKVLAFVRNIEKANMIYEDLKSRQDLEFIQGDIRNKLQIDHSIDYIIHCASVTTSKSMIDYPVETILTSIEGTKNVLEIAKEKSVKSFIYISSMEMYGKFNDLDHNVEESDLGYINPLEIRSNYPESKRVCENMCIAYWKEYSVPVKIARLAQTFGAGILPGENRVFAQFARAAIKKQDIILHTNGLSEGNYCYTRDTMKALIILLNKGSDGEAYNISNENTHTTIKDMAYMVANEITGGAIKVIYDIPETNEYGYAGEVKMKLDSSKMRSLGWEPEVNLKEAYERLIKSICLSEIGINCND